MEPDRHSITAVFTAFLRAYHATHEPTPIFSDSLAKDLVPPQAWGAIEAGLAHQAPGGDVRTLVRSLPGSVHTLTRSRYAEASLEVAVARGTSQYLILGAGLDSFGWRIPPTWGELEVFEVDHPATQGFKVDRLRALGLEGPRVRLVACDFTRDRLDGVLAASGLRAERPTFVSWLGTSMYLPEASVRQTLGDLSRCLAPGSELVFDVLEAGAFGPEAAPQVAELVRWAAAAGEPMAPGLSLEAWGSLIDDCGWAVDEVCSPADIGRRWIPDPGFQACEHLHFFRCRVRDPGPK